VGRETPGRATRHWTHERASTRSVPGGGPGRCRRSTYRQKTTPASSPARRRLEESRTFTLAPPGAGQAPLVLRHFFPAAIPERPHPFPSRTRKLSSPGPMVLQGELCGRVGRCRGFEGPRSQDRGPSPFSASPRAASPGFGPLGLGVGLGRGRGRGLRVASATDGRRRASGASGCSVRPAGGTRPGRRTRIRSSPGAASTSARATLREVAAQLEHPHAGSVLERDAVARVRLDGGDRIACPRTTTSRFVRDRSVSASSQSVRRVAARYVPVVEHRERVQVTAPKGIGIGLGHGGPRARPGGQVRRLPGSGRGGAGQGPVRGRRCGTSGRRWRSRAARR
jgi:hypothetical protein